MKLERKKDLAARTLGVGKSRVRFNKERLAEIKQAITKQDIRDLLGSGAIRIEDVKGRLKVQRRKARRRTGSVKKKVSKGKDEHVRLVRSLRGLLVELKKQKRVHGEHYHQLRKEIKSHQFKTKAQLHERAVHLHGEKKAK